MCVSLHLLNIAEQHLRKLNPRWEEANQTKDEVKEGNQDTVEEVGGLVHWPWACLTRAPFLTESGTFSLGKALGEELAQLEPKPGHHS